MNYKIKQLGAGKIEFTISKNEFDIDEIVKNNKEEFQYIFLKKQNVDDSFMNGYATTNNDNFILSEFEKIFELDYLKEKSIILNKII